MKENAARPLVSLIVPAFNLAGKIGGILETLMSQDYENIEIIVVDDASTDGTAIAAERILSKGRIRFLICLHDKNRGVSAARNTGFDNVGGEFVAFVDGDDFVDNNFVSVLLDAILKNNSDISLCGFRSLDEKTGMTKRHIEASVLSQNRGPEDFAILRILKKIDPGIWSMLFRKTFLDSVELRFAEGCSAGEDVEFQIKALARSRATAFVNACPYVYVIHETMGSMSAIGADKAVERYIHNTEAHFRLYKYLATHAKTARLRDIAEYFLLPEAYARQFTAYARQKNMEDFMRLASCKETKRVLWSSRRSFSRKPEIFVKALLLLLCPKAYFRLRSR
jgi:glycosyltransferase involved in cell wall biosynthesis